VMYFTQFETNLLTGKILGQCLIRFEELREQKVTKCTRNLKKNVSSVEITSDITSRQVTHKVYTDPKNFQQRNEFE